MYIVIPPFPINCHVLLPPFFNYIYFCYRRLSFLMSVYIFYCCVSLLSMCVALFIFCNLFYVLVYKVSLSLFTMTIYEDLGRYTTYTFYRFCVLEFSPPSPLFSTSAFKRRESRHTCFVRLLELSPSYCEGAAISGPFYSPVCFRLYVVSSDVKKKKK